MTTTGVLWIDVLAAIGGLLLGLYGLNLAIHIVEWWWKK